MIKEVHTRNENRHLSMGLIIKTIHKDPEKKLYNLRIDKFTIIEKIINGTS